MSVYRKKTEDFTFSLTNDKGLLIKNNNYKPTTAPEELFSATSPGYTFFKYENLLTQELKVHNFIEGMKSHAAGLIVQTVLSSFSHMFVKGGNQREQLLEGLRYFFFSDHYEVLVANNTKALSALRKTYNDIIKNEPKFKQEHDDLIEKARTLHLQEPFIASTGLIVYSSRDAVWVASETTELSPDTPEYLYSVSILFDVRVKETARANVFKGRQKNCIQYILDDQKKLYGFSLDEISKKTIEKNSIDKMRTELEVVLSIPKEQRREYLEEQSRQEELREAAVETNLTQLDQYATLKK